MAALSKNYLKCTEEKEFLQLDSGPMDWTKNSAGVLVIAGALSHRVDGSRQGN
jgi:hypothetical protein